MIVSRFKGLIDLIEPTHSCSCESRNNCVESGG